MTGTPIVDDVRAANEGTVRVDRDYLRALEILANEHFESTATRSEYREARRLVANRTGVDAPVAWERGDE